MITICIAVLGYIPVYAGTTGYYRDVVACFLYLFTGYIQYVSLFLPKLYVVIFRPDKNISMGHTIKSPNRTRQSIASGFESEGYYLPTEKELDKLKNVYKSRKRKRKKPRGQENGRARNDLNTELPAVMSTASTRKPSVENDSLKS